MKLAKIKKEDLKVLFENLAPNYRIIGPKIVGGTILMSEISADDIPAGYMDNQQPGSYRVEKGSRNEIFSFSPGPDSLKKFLQPSVTEAFFFRKTSKGLTAEVPAVKDKPMAFIGIRACDLTAMSLLDKIFLEGPVRHSGYEARRKDIFIVAVNCLHPGDNCFCDSMGAGPEAKEGFDLAITEISNSLLVEAGSVQGEAVLERLPHDGVNDIDLDEKKSLVSRCRDLMKKSMKTRDLPGIIYKNMEHPRWAEIARKDLECGNCTMVCPTCFCNSSFDILSVKTISANLKEFPGIRKRTWDSCFSRNFARVHGGNFRPSRRARYRHWMTHKLAYWIDQFGRPGCVGCGRCITWCPAGIDITHELEELRRVR